MDPLGVGLIGCGNISTIYLTNIPKCGGLEVRGVSDVAAEVAKAQGKRFGVAAMPVDKLLKRADIDIVVNLTIPVAHAGVSLDAVSADKHVFSEKPLGTEFDEAQRLVNEAEARGVRLGCAPDTFLGAGGRLARKLVDDGTVGRILSGTAFIMSHGMEHWHPNPEFFYKRGGGPVLDVGPYYLHALINLIGPVARVRSVAATGHAERVVSADGPRKGSSILVETPTTVHAILEFKAGAQVMIGASWDVWKHSHPAIELYGTDGSIRVPDPNFFGGIVETSEHAEDWVAHDSGGLPMGAANWPDEDPVRANYRALGVAELAASLREGKPHRSNGRLALHALEVMIAAADGSAEGGPAVIATELEQPAVLSEVDAAALFSP